jgi:RNA polymerase sigma-70 factor (ECF subfamily)
MSAIIDERTVNPVEWLERHGDYLYRFAMFRVRDESVAEDLVQETLLAALESIDRFSGKSSERTWLVAILKHKIIDHFRKSNRETVYDFSESTDEDFFQPNGYWKPEQVSATWNDNPSALVENKEFWKIVERCLSALPSRIAAAFTLREIDGLSSEEVCRVLEISPNNLWVMLHRARTQLRREMEINFFNPKKIRIQYAVASELMAA